MLSEKFQSKLDCNIGCYILEELYCVNEFDLLDAFSVIYDFVPANYICSREAYYWK